MRSGITFDQVFRSFIVTKFFTKGWGDVKSLKRILKFRHMLSKRESCMSLVDKNHPVRITKKNDTNRDCDVLEGEFLSPFAIHHPTIMPEVAQTAKFRLVLPKKWSTDLKPVCIHLAGTGDHGFDHREWFMAKPLVKEAQIGSLLLENPYYGCRKPAQQKFSGLLHVTDLFVMGGALVLECIVLLNWLQREGFGPLGITGISLGGHIASAAGCSWPQPISLVPLLSWSTASVCFTQMASLAASCWPQPISFVPCLSWSTASMVWIQGLLSQAVEWDALDEMYRTEIKHHEKELDLFIESPEKHRWEKCQSMIHNIDISSKDVPISEYQKLLKQLDLYSPTLPKKVINIETIHLLRRIMDQCTHLGNFEPPVDQSLIIPVTAQCDDYMPRDRVISLTDIWPGCEIRYLNRGHVSSILFNKADFRKAIIESFDRQINKYYPEAANMDNKRRMTY